MKEISSSVMLLPFTGHNGKAFSAVWQVSVSAFIIQMQQQLLKASAIVVVNI